MHGISRLQRSKRQRSFNSKCSCSLTVWCTWCSEQILWLSWELLFCLHGDAHPCRVLIFLQKYFVLPNKRWFWSGHRRRAVVQQDRWHRFLDVRWGNCPSLLHLLLHQYHACKCHRPPGSEAPTGQLIVTSVSQICAKSPEQIDVLKAVQNLVVFPSLFHWLARSVSLVHVPQKCWFLAEFVVQESAGLPSSQQPGQRVDDISHAGEKKNRTLSWKEAGCSANHFHLARAQTKLSGTFFRFHSRTFVAWLSLRFPKPPLLVLHSTHLISLPEMCRTMRLFWWGFVVHYLL